VFQISKVFPYRPGRQKRSNNGVQTSSGGPKEAEYKNLTLFGMSLARVIKNTNCQQNGGCCVESTEDPKWISPSNSSPSPPSCVRRLLPVIIRCVARIPLRVSVSRAQTRRNGPLSLIGPPCLLSPYRFCQYTTGILTVRAGGRRGEERRGTGRREGSRGQLSKN